VIQREVKTLKGPDNVYSKEMEVVLQTYMAYSNETQNGKNGKTAKFWFSYIKMIHLYHEYSRSIRIGDGLVI
jgi:hypothetical protein